MRRYPELHENLLQASDQYKLFTEAMFAKNKAHRDGLAHLTRLQRLKGFFPHGSHYMQREWPMSHVSVLEVLGSCSHLTWVDNFVQTATGIWEIDNSELQELVWPRR